MPSGLDRLLALPRFADDPAGAYRPGLGRVRALLRAMGDPHRAAPVVHVGGTNGKGSTASMVAAIGTASGARVGLLTSPTLLHPAEMARVDGVPQVGPFAAAAGRWVGEAESLGCSFFEAAVAFAFAVFAEAAVALAVVEVGLGGADDATAVVDPAVCVVTSVGLDHTDVLGATRPAIARVKAGIAAPGVPFLHAVEGPDTVEALEAEARARGALPERVRETVSISVAGTQDEPAPSPSHPSTSPLPPGEGRPPGRRSQGEGSRSPGPQSEARPRAASPDGGPPRVDPRTPRLVVLDTPRQRVGPVALGLPGAHQWWNAALAVRAIETARPETPRDAIERGLRDVVGLAGLRGRSEAWAGDPRVVLDVAHNADGLRAALAAVPAGRLTVVLGMMADKAAPEVAAVLRERAAEVRAVGLDTPRALPAAALAGRLRAAGLETVREGGTVAAAVQVFRQSAGPDDRLLVTGSHRTVAEALRALEGDGS